MFRRILLWFGGMLLFSFAAYFVTWLWWSPAAQDRDEFFRSVFDFEATEAVRAYESGGPAALRRYLDNVDAHLHARHYLTDPSGRDLLDGTDRSELLKAPQHGRSLIPRRPPVLRRPTAGGRYIFLGQGRPHVSFWKDLSAYAWIVLVIFLLCYVLAWRLAPPNPGLARDRRALRTG